MAFTTSALVTFALPTTYADNVTPWPAANYGGAVVFLNGAKVATVAAPDLSVVVPNLPVGDDSFTVEVLDNVTGLTSAASAPVVYTQAAAPQPPAAPTIVSIVAS